ncbi:MAG: hypothetical protein EB060_11395, partial [Proteobacteria bacterium]|nr:hypothetical protein [Pseudomonadota bacterium]
IWVHEREMPALIGFDIRLRWTAPLHFEIRKGHGYFDQAPARLGSADHQLAVAERTIEVKSHGSDISAA